MSTPEQPHSIVCPFTDASYFESALTLVCESGYDPSLPLPERMYRLAGEAVGFGLRVGCDYADELEALVASAYGPDSPTHHVRDQARAFVLMYTSSTTQHGLVESVQRAGAPLLAVLVLLLVQYAREIPPANDLDGDGRMVRAMTAFFLHSVLLLVRDHPSEARMYRSLVPG